MLIPLPRNAGAIPKRLHKMPKSFLLRGQNPEIFPIPMILPARHDL